VNQLGAAMTRHSSGLANALTQEQVDIANRFHRQLPRWQMSDQALFKLRDRVPEWDSATCLLKSVAIDALYGTNVYMNWLKGIQINAELRNVLIRPSRSQADMLNAFLPPNLERRFFRNMARRAR
jgi:hypothetical protein